MDLSADEPPESLSKGEGEAMMEQAACVQASPVVRGEAAGTSAEGAEGRAVLGGSICGQGAARGAALEGAHTGGMGAALEEAHTGKQLARMAWMALHRRRVPLHAAQQVSGFSKDLQHASNVHLLAVQFFSCLANFQTPSSSHGHAMLQVTQEMRQETT